MKLDRVLPIAFPDLNKTFYFLRFKFVADSDRQTPLLKSDIVATKPVDACPYYEFVHVEDGITVEPGLPQRIGEVAERAFRINDQNCAQGSEIYAPNVDDPAVKIGARNFVRAQLPYTWSYKTPAPESVAKRLKNIESILDFFGAKGKNGFLEQGANAYTKSLVKSLGMMSDRRAFDFALKKNILSEAWLENSAWDRLPQIDEYLVSLYPDKLAFYEIIEKLWIINPNTARLFVKQALQKQPQLKASNLSSLVQRLPYHEFVELALVEYDLLDETEKILFLNYTFTVPGGHDEIFEAFLKRELAELQNRQNGFDNFYTREKTAKVLSDYLAVLSERRQKHLYTTKTFIEFANEKRYLPEATALLRGMRFSEKGAIEFGSLVVVKKEGQTLRFRLNQTPELVKKLRELKPGDAITFEGTFNNLELYSREDNSILILLDYVEIKNAF